MTRKIKLIIPAAGSGTRMNLPYPKTLYPVAGEPILGHILKAAVPVIDEGIVVVSPEGKAHVEAFLARSDYAHIATAVQEKPVGMADAVEIGARAMGGTHVCDYLIIWGDQVTVRTETLRKVKEHHRVSEAWLTFPTTWRRDPYIHIVRDGTGNVIGVLEAREGDAMPDEGENDCGVFMARGEHLLDGLTQLRDATYDGATGRFQRLDKSASVTGEFNFLPLITMWARGDRSVQGLTIAGANESIGVNTLSEAAHLDPFLAFTFSKWPLR